MKKIVAKTVVIMLCVVAALSGVFWWQLKRYEDGIIDIYANQQDAYVQLVLDQINLKENREEEEIINEILSSLDASTNKYWTFSNAQSLLFIKDVLETNKYKGFTSESYYSDENARNFLETLIVNKVTHSIVTVDEKSYVASGVAFEYSGNEYKLCLLTNRDTLLENNSFLGSKVLICTVIAIILIFMFLFTTISARRYQQVLEKNGEIKQDVAELQAHVAELNDALREKRSRDTKQKIWSEDLLPDFIARMGERGIQKAAFIVVRCRNEAAKKEFLAGANITLDESVIRFEKNENDILLIGIDMNCRLLSPSVIPCIVEGCSMGERLDVNGNENLTLDYVNEFLKEA